MKTIELKNFIKTGKFETIEVGTSKKQDVINLMGTDFDFADCGESQIIKYGWYEFFYNTKTELVFGIQNDHLQYNCTNHNEMIDYQNEHLKIDTWFLKANEDKTFSEIIEILKDEEIDFEIEKYNYDGALPYLKLVNEITIDFSNESTIWAYNQPLGEWKGETKIIHQQDDYILNGIRLFKH